MKSLEHELACQKRRAANRAFEESFAVHGEEVRKFLLGYLDGDEKAAETALTLTFFQVYRTLHRTGLSPNRAELFTMATDHAIDFKGMDAGINREQFFRLRGISANPSPAVG